MFRPLNNDKVNHAMNMLGITPIAYSPPVMVKTVSTPTKILIDDDNNDDCISVESIIKDKPPIKEVREFFKDNLEELTLMDN